VDGEEQPLSLMKLVKATQTKTSPNNSIIAFHDNSSAIKGFTVPVGPTRFLAARCCYYVLSTGVASQADRSGVGAHVSPCRGPRLAADGRDTQLPNWHCSLPRRHNCKNSCCQHYHLLMSVVKGTGGRIRDVQATGRGAHVVAGTAGYCVGNLHIPGYTLPWEDKVWSGSETIGLGRLMVFGCRA
jgi:phosphoribosylformylglycinamidine synthase